jgi:hypothetical protein
LFPIGTKAVTIVATIMLPIRSSFIVPHRLEGGCPRTFSRGDIQAASFSLYSFSEQ